MGEQMQSIIQNQQHKGGKKDKDNDSDKEKDKDHKGGKNNARDIDFKQRPVIFAPAGSN